jgi:DNA polymerase epsilon subunit 1
MSISTAKRLAEFLGDEMVKDKGLNCKYVISKKPEGTTVTERAIPIAIFQAEPSVQKHFLKKWLKAQSQSELEIRNFLDWDYYIERLSGCIQKIITIPAALQGVLNPVSRVAHPDWLHKRLAERNSNLKQRKINELFSAVSAPFYQLKINEESSHIEDIENLGSSKVFSLKSNGSINTNEKESSRNSSAKRKKGTDFEEKKFLISWRSIIGEPPSHRHFKEWLSFHKRKWMIQIDARFKRKQGIDTSVSINNVVNSNIGLTNFIKKSVNNRFQISWEIISITDGNRIGEFTMWILVDTELLKICLEIPRIFYVNQMKPLENQSNFCHRSNKHLPRSQQPYHLYEYQIPENVFQSHQNDIIKEFSNPYVEGIYEMNVPLLFRALIDLGCICGPKRETKKKVGC